ncbi:hypothetical protein [uncultured Eubacterium sp.]|uniref:hypothetical protein n=1 Tax=uncultured Eubacterium sp. TaxID=165185 RepID=UPI0026745474|nr:hypothetical protein [uncultured Eubacterium sp.]
MRNTEVRKRVRSPDFHPLGKITSHKGVKMGNTEERKRVRSPAFHPLGKITSHKGWKNEKY